MIEVGSAYVSIYPDTSGFSKAVSKGIDGRSIGNSISDGILSPLKVALGVTLGNLATKAGQAIGNNIGKGIQRIDTIKNFPKLMETFGYSTDAATRSIENIQDHLDGLPGSTDEVLRLVQSLSDSTGSLELATSTGLAFNDMLTAAGADATTAAMATRMFDQMMGGAEFSSQRWYAIVSKMPLQMRMVAEHILGAGASVEDLGAALENGTVSMQDMAQAMTDLSPQFEEQARAMSDGIGTAMTNVSNRIAKGIAEIIDAFGRENIAGAINAFGTGFKDTLVGVADAVTFVITRFDELGVADKLAIVAQGIADFFGVDSSTGDTLREAFYGILNVMAEWIDRALQWFIDHGAEIGEMLRPMTDALADFILRAGDWLIATGEALGGVIDNLFGILTSTDPNPIKDLANAIGDITKALGEAILDAFDWLADHPDLLQGIIVGIGAAIATSMLITALPALAQGIIAVSNALVSFFSSNIVVLIIGATAALIYFFTQTEEGKAIVEGFVDGVMQWWDIFSKKTEEIFEGISNFLTDTWDNIKNWVSERVETLVTGVIEVWDNVKQSTLDTWEAIKKTVSDVVEAVKTTVENVWNGLRDTVSSIWDGIKSAITGAIDGARQFVSDKVDAIKTTVGDVFDGLRATTENIWDRIKDGMISPIEGAQNTISGIIDTIKGFFNFDWKLPQIKLPHIEITGWSDFPIIGSIPTGWAVNWYAGGGFVNSATLIGAGEKGAEAILPLTARRRMRPFAQAVAAEMGSDSGVSIADNTFIVREEADIYRIAEQLNEMITIQRMGALA